MPLVSSGGASQVKDTGHNGMESIGICLPVLTLSVFLVREIRTDNHLHPSPPPRAHPPESNPVTQDSTRLPASTNKTRPRGEERRGARAQANTRDVPIRTRTKKLLCCGSSSLEISGIGTGAAGGNALRVRCPPPTHLASPALAHLYSKTPSARRTRNSNADRPPPARREPCGEGGRPARREPGTPTPSPTGGGQPAAGTPPPQI